MLEKILNKLEVSDKELDLFRNLKENYYVSDELYIKDNKKYKIVIEYDVNYIGRLFDKEIAKDELFYTLKVGNKKILNRVRKSDVVKYLKCNIK